MNHSWAARDGCDLRRPDAFGFVGRCVILCQIGETAVDTLHRDIHIAFDCDVAARLLEQGRMNVVLSPATFGAILRPAFGLIEVDTLPPCGRINRPPCPRGRACSLVEPFQGTSMIEMLPG